ncbi:uncharacterized protein RB166_016155 [Leptodactylus fuscus]
MSDGFELGSMSEDESRMAVEAHIRAINILEDALKKKEWLLAVPGRDYGQRAGNIPLICPQLVELLIQTLQKTELLKHNITKQKPGIGVIFPPPSAPVIGLYSEFWESHENLGPCSRPGTLIKAAAYTLGYHECYEESWVMAGGGDNWRSVLSAGHICEAFEVWMRHPGEHVAGSYTCCGETSEHSVCEDSKMRLFLHAIMDEEQKELAETSRRATLEILFDTRTKELFVDICSIDVETTMVTSPLITRTLLDDLINQLQRVEFKCDNKPRNETVFAYPDAREKNVIYLCPFFWKQSDRLSCGSRPGTLILCASIMLGYSHMLDGTSNPGEHTGRQERELLKADDICAAFECWMKHREPYKEGSYSCCGEKKKDSVCTESAFGVALREYNQRKPK